MSQELIVGVIGAFAVVLAAFLGLPLFGRDPRSAIKQELDIYLALPPGFDEARENLRASIEEQIRSNTGQNPASRSPAQVVLGLVILVIAGVAGYYMFLLGSWFFLASPIVLFLILLGLVGLSQALKKVPRDSKGAIIK